MHLNNADFTVGESNSPYVGGFGGVAQGPFRCPSGMFVSGLLGKSASYYGAYNVITLRGELQGRHHRRRHFG